MDSVAVHVTVQGRDGRLVRGLGKSDFSVLDNSRPVDITVFSADPQPIRIALMLDMSGSMASHITRMRTASNRFFAALEALDRATVGSFKGR